MKMFRCSSSPDENVVLISHDTNFHLLEATHCKQKVWCCLEELVKPGSCKSQDTETCLGFAGGHPRQHPSSSHNSICVSNHLITP